MSTFGVKQFLITLDFRGWNFSDFCGRNFNNFSQKIKFIKIRFEHADN